MADLFNQTYYGNTIGTWALSFGLILLFFIVGRALYWFIGRYIKKLTANTETKLDDILVDQMEEPIVAFIVLFGSSYALNILTLSDNVSQFFENGFSFALTIIIAWLILRVYEAIHEEYIIPFTEKTESDLDDQLLPIMRSGIRVLVISLGIIVGLNNAGYDVGTVLAGLGIGGLAFALAAQDTVANIFGGITIFLQRPFSIGDYILWEDQWLKAEEIGLRASTFRDREYSHKVIVPNSKFTTNKIINASAFPGQHEYVTFTLSHKNSTAKVERAMELMHEIPANHPEASLDITRIDAIRLEGIDLRLGFVSASYPDRQRIKTEVMLEVLKQFELNEIELAVPKMTYVEIQAPDTIYG